MAWRIEIPYDRNSPYICEDSDEAAEVICNSDEYKENYEIDESDFDEYINCSYGSIDVCGWDYEAAEVLKAVSEERYYEWKREQEIEEASENTDSVREELDSNEYDRGGVWFCGNIRAFYIEDKEDEDEDDEGHDQDEVFDCFAIAT